MAVGLIAWARFPGPAAGQRITVPAPTTNPGKPFLWDFLHTEAANLAASFDIVQLPPWSLAEGGASPGSDGYGLFERRNLNGTRYGSLESLMAAIAALNAHGCQTYGDLVLHQMSGENGGPGVFKYSGKDGNKVARGQTAPGWFRGGLTGNDPIPPFRPEDDVPDRGSDNAFGRELSYQHAIPAGVTEEDAKDYLTWAHARTGAVGFRFDDTKGTHAQSVRRIMDSLPTTPFYSEYFDGNPANLNNWATQQPMNGRSAVQDFPLHFRIQAACDNFDATQFEQGGPGYFAWNSGLSVGFIDNPDTDTSPGQQVVFNKGLAYAYLLTLPLRLALVYGKDYFPSSVWPGAYGLHTLIDNLTWISRTFAFGAYQVRWFDRDVHVASRDGNGGAAGRSGGLLTALNFNTLSPRTITCATPFGPNRWLHDYTGHHHDIATDSNGNVTFTIPSNAFATGQSYLCFAPGGVSQPFTNRPRSTTQSYFGVFDLDVRTAMNGAHVLPQRVFCAKDSHVSMALLLKAAHETLPKGWAVNATVHDKDGTLIAQLRIGTAATTPPSKAPGKAAQTGWHTITVEGFNLPTAGADYRLDINYTGHPA